MKKQEIKTLVDGWRERSIISADQAVAILEDVTNYTSEKSGNSFILWITYIGSLALSLGVLLLIASNWDGLGKGVQLALALLLPVVPLAFAYWQQEVRNIHNVIGRSAGILGTILVGGSLALIGQIYHLESDMTTFLGTWLVLTAPLIFVFKKAEQVVFTTIMSGLVLGSMVIDWLGYVTLEDWTILILITGVALLYAGAVYGVGCWLRRSISWQVSGWVLRIGGAGVACTTLFLTTFEFYARGLTGEAYWGDGGSNWVAFSIGFNIFFLGFLVFALLRALKYEEYGFAFSVVRLFGIYLLVKYYTLFSSMLDTGVFFIIGGVLFIAGGYMLEKQKHKLVNYMKRAHVEVMHTDHG